LVVSVVVTNAFQPIQTAISSFLFKLRAEIALVEGLEARALEAVSGVKVERRGKKGRAIP
jgi:hypothetical protein